MSRVRRYIFLGIGLLGLCFAVVFGLFLVAVGRTLTLKEIDFLTDVEETERDFVLNDALLQKYVSIMSEALKFRTVSQEQGIYDTQQLLQLQHFLIKSFPSVFNSSFIDVEIVNNYSILLTVKGSNPTLPPFMLTSHLDVVPVDPQQWSLPPFLGEVVTDPETGEPCIWGRGAIDDKAGVIGILSALDLLIMNEWKPTRSFYVAFGHDEEVSGQDGAGHIGRLLTERNVSLEFLLDEGMPIVQGLMTGIDAPIALIGVTEKGRMEVRISAKGEGGHSSIPPKSQAVEKLSNALVNLYKNPQPSMFGLGPEQEMLQYLAPKASWPYNLLFCNTWLFGPLLSFVMSQKSQSNAFLRTTTAVTIINGGIKSNVVPATAWALVNHRVHPSQSLDDVLAHDVAAIGDDTIQVEMLEGVGPHPISSYGPESEPFKLIAGAVKKMYPEAVIAPSLTVGNTDTRFYLNLTSDIYRFIPVLVTPITVGSIHGKDERLSLSNFKSAILFYQFLIRKAQQESKHRRPLRFTEEL